MRDVVSVRVPAIAVRLPEAWLVVLLGAIASAALVMSFPDNVGVKVLAMTLLWFVSVAGVKFDIAHPFFWFGGPFLIYSIAGPLLFALDIHPFMAWGGFLMRELDFAFAMDLQFWGLLVSLMIIGPARLDLGASLRDGTASRFFDGVLPVLAVTVVLSGFAVSEIVSQGYLRKIDLVLYGDWSTRFSFALNMVSTCFGVYLIKQFVQGKAIGAYATVAVFVLTGLMIVMLAGQRNYLFRLLIVAVFAYHIAHRAVSFRGTFVLFVTLSPFILILGGLKMSGIGDLSAGSMVSIVEQAFDRSRLVGELGFTGDSSLLLFGKFLLYLIFSDEFMTGGNNLAMLVSRMPAEIPFQHGATLVHDVASGLSPGFLQINPGTSGYTYNAIVFPANTEQGGGQGFTLVGAGYMNFGTEGAVMIMAAFGMVVRIVYRWAAKSAMGLFFFVGFLPVSFAAARNDLSMPVSQSLKHVLFPLLMMLIVSYLLGRDSRRTRPQFPSR